MPYRTVGGQHPAVAAAIDTRAHSAFLGSNQCLDLGGRERREVVNKLATGAAEARSVIPLHGAPFGLAW
jgi:hypothetical protein